MTLISNHLLKNENQNTMTQANRTRIFELSAVSKIVFVVCLVIFIVTGLITLWLLNTNNTSQPLVSIVTALVLFSGIGLLLMFYFSWRHFTMFCLDINQWANQLIKGDLSSRMTLDDKTPSREIRSLINKISDDSNLFRFLNSNALRDKQSVSNRKSII